MYNHTLMELKDKESFENNQHIQQKRGRGRPRKNQVVNDIEKNKKIKNPHEIKKFVKELTEKETDDEIILHMPIFLKDIDKIKKNSVFEKKDKLDQKRHELHEQYEQHDDDDNNKTENSKHIFTINDINNDLFNSDDSGSNSNSNSLGEVDNLFVNDLKQTIKMQEKKIKKLEQDIIEYKNVLTETANHGLNERKATRMACDFIFIDSTSGNQFIAENTNIACWWCTYNFDTVPCFIPEKFQNDRYHVFGCFCSYNCAASYNLKMDDSCVWNRYSLLKKMYNKIYQNNDEIKLAPQREVFEKFGGPLKYEEYRKNSIKCNKEYRFLMPPMAPIVPIIEEGRVENKTNVKLSDLNKKNLILKRTKPLPNSKNNLLETLGIKSN